MITFTSDVSSKQFPIAERLSGKTVRNGVLREIIKVHADFNEHSFLAMSEFNEFRQQYIHNLLAKEVGALTDLELTVLDSIQYNQILADEASGFKTGVLTRSQRLADKIASLGGSWKFIVLSGIFIVSWMALNVYGLHNRGYDPYPFILLNLILSCVAALQAPVIMMSQNRQGEKDRERSRNDYMVNLKGELEVRMLHEKIDHLIIRQQENLLEIQQVMTEAIPKLFSEHKTNLASYRY